MFNIGMPELLLILAVALIVLGPKRLPEIARALGKIVGEFRRTTQDIRDDFDISKTLREEKEKFVQDVEGLVEPEKDKRKSKTETGDIKKEVSGKSEKTISSEDDLVNKKEI